MTRFPDGRKATAMGISGIAMGFAPNIGPTIGGAMVESLGWRSFFWLLVALTVVVGIACQFAVKRRDDASYPAGFDVLSFALSALGFGGLLMGASEVSSYSFIHPFVWAPLIAGGCVPPSPLRNDSVLWKTRLSIWLFSTTGNSSTASGRSIACLLRSWALRCLCRFILKDCAGEAPCRLVSCFCRVRLPRLSRTRLRACSSTRLERDRHAVFRGVSCYGFVPHGYVRCLDAFVGRVRHARRAFDGRFGAYWSAYRVELIGASWASDFRWFWLWHRCASSVRFNRVRRHGVLRLRRRIGG